MPFPRVRFTLRRMMIAVAIVAILLGLAEMTRRRRAAFREKSTAIRWSEYVEGHGKRRPEIAEHYRRMAEKYERAARYPWLPVAPDPPEPE